jgi:catechol 2,3-dioxygenase-like lactoylglutathione lyase family enzyme
MKRLHVGLSVTDLERSIAYYTVLFDAEPVVRKPDYAKWMLDDPRVNFSINSRLANAGVDHLGIQTDDTSEVGVTAARLARDGIHKVETPGATCCYARSDKVWSWDPDGVAWEVFKTHGQTEDYGTDSIEPAPARQACC